MNKAELKIIEKELIQIYGSWHVCGLDVISAKTMKLKPGRLCDDCLSSIKLNLNNIKVASEDQ